MTQADFKPAYLEDMHARILKEFHGLRGQHHPYKPLTVELNWMQLNDHIVKAKNSIYQERPASRAAGFES